MLDYLAVAGGVVFLLVVAVCYASRWGVLCAFGWHSHGITSSSYDHEAGLWRTTCGTCGNSWYEEPVK